MALLQGWGERHRSSQLCDTARGWGFNSTSRKRTEQDSYLHIFLLHSVSGMQAKTLHKNRKMKTKMLQSMGKALILGFHKINTSILKQTKKLLSVVLNYGLLKQRLASLPLKELSRRNFLPVQNIYTPLFSTICAAIFNSYCSLHGRAFSHRLDCHSKWKHTWEDFSGQLSLCPLIAPCLQLQTRYSQWNCEKCQVNARMNPAIAE